MPMSKKARAGQKAYHSFYKKQRDAGKTHKGAIAAWKAHKKAHGKAAPKKSGKKSGKKGGARKPHESHGKLLKKHPKWWMYYRNHLIGLARRRLKYGPKYAKMFADSVIFLGEQAVLNELREKFKRSDAKAAIAEAKIAADQSHDAKDEEKEYLNALGIEG